MNACDPMQQYLDGNLSVPETYRYEAHLAACTDCAEDVAQWTMTREVLTDCYDLAVIEPDGALVERLLARAAEEDAIAAEGRRVRSRSRSRWAALLVASVLSALALGALVATFAPGRHSYDDAPFQDSIQAPLQEVAHVSDLVADRPGVPLPDGVSAGEGYQIWVGQGSSVRAVEGDDASLEIEAGVLIVQTEPGADPVSVFAGPYVIADIGTTFQVRYSPGELLQVTVAEGLVEVGGFGDLPLRVNRSQRLSVWEQSAYMTLEDEDPDLIGHLRLPFEEDVPQAASSSAADNRKQDTASPDDAGALELHLGRWRRMVIDGLFADALKEIVPFIQQRNDDPRVWSILGDCRRKTSDWQGAVKAYEQVVKKGTAAQSERASFLMGEIFQDQLGNYERALEAYDLFLKTANTGRLRGAVLLRIAESRRARGELSEAKEALKEIVDGSYDDDMKRRAQALAESLLN